MLTTNKPGFGILFALLTLVAVSVEEQTPPEIVAESIGDDVYRLTITNENGILGAHLAAYVARDGVILVDDHFAHPYLSGLIDRQLGELSDGAPIRFVVNTHYHPDHNGGNGYFGSSATVVAQEKVSQRLAAGTKALNLTVPGRIFTFAPRPAADLPSETFADSLTLTVGGAKTRLVHYANSHTDGDTVVFFPGSRIVATGDLVWPGQFPSVDVLNGGNVVNLHRTIRAILDRLPPDARIVIGHGPVADVEDLEAFAEMLSDTTEFVRQSIEEGRSLDEIQEIGLPDDWSAWAHPQVPERTWIFTIYASLVS